MTYETQVMLGTDWSFAAWQDVYHTGQIYPAAEYHKVGA